MIIQKVINNNVVSTFDMNNHEVILMGKGIGFRKKAGDELDKTKIEKIFTLDQREKSPFIQEVLAIIQEFYEISFNAELPAYQRFITHLEYLENSIKSGESHSTRETRKNIRRLIYAARKLSSTLKVITATPCP